MSKHDSDGADASRIEALTRRSFFRLNAALIAVAGTTSCTWRGQPLDTRDALHLLRAEDLLSLRVELSNLFIQHRFLKSARLVRERAGQSATMTFVLSGQHIAEQAFDDLVDTNPSTSPVLPVGTRIAPPTRLTFKWPESLQHIDLTMDHLLAWEHWQFLPKQSTVSIPAGMQLEMNIADRALDALTQIRWAAAREPVTINGRSELWHLRLLQEGLSDAGLPVVIRLAAPESCASPSTQPDAFDLTPNQQERCAVNGKTAYLRSLLLSPMGAWLDLDGKWETGAVRRWTHRTAAGQDQRVLVEGGEGFLFPFGHSASLVTVTERKIALARNENDEPRRAAILQKRSFIVIKQPTLLYPVGETVFEQLTVRQKVTPPLSGLDEVNPAEEPFWIETSGLAFEFHFDAVDWAGHSSQFSAPAVFVMNEPVQVPKAKTVYDNPRSDEDNKSNLSAQAVVVSPYQPKQESNEARSEGDTLLHLLQIEHSARIESGSLDAADNRRFYWQTPKLQARIPALINNLQPEINIGWFDLLQPDDNMGELFAIASEGARRIPMSFSERADRSGGVVAPSIDVQGISRIFGPVSDAKSVRETGQFSADNYFSDDAKILGGFGLQEIGGEEKSTLIPQFFFTVSKEEIKKKKEWYEDETDEEKAAPKQFKTTVETGLKWQFQLPTFSIPILFIRLASRTSDKGKSLSTLNIKTALKRTFQPANEDAAESEDADTATSEEAPPADEDKKPLADWSAKGSIENFDLILLAAKLGSLTFLFDELSLTLGPPDTKNGQDEAAISKKVSCELGDIKGEGALAIVAPFLKILAGLPVMAKFSHVSGTVVPYPASVPSVTDADAYISIGPIPLPDIKFANFSITDISASFGLGCFFFGRENKAQEIVVPGNRIMLALGTSDKPLTVMAEPWGGASHIAMSFDFGHGLSGFQFGLGVVFGSKFDFKIGKAKCIGSLSLIYTYVNTDDMPLDNSLTLMLRIDGKAHLAGWIDITLRIAASGTYGTSGIAFELRILLQVKIAFFTVGVSLQLRHEIETAQTDRLGAAADSFDMNKEQWLQYQSAFAGARS